MVDFPPNVNPLPHTPMLVKPYLANFRISVRVDVKVANRRFMNGWRGVNVPRGVRAVPGGGAALKGKGA
jgi:hypothetical protein